MTGLEEFIAPIRKLVRYDKQFRTELSNCQCHQCRDNPCRLYHILYVTPYQMIEKTCCDAVPHDPDLAVGTDESQVIPRFIKWECVYDSCHDTDTFGEGSCLHCGIRKLFECDTVRERMDTDYNLYETMIWEKTKITRSRATQFEIHKRELTFEEIVSKLDMQLQKARRHYVTFRWSDHALRRLREMIDPTESMTIATDFSATMNMESSLKDNSNIPKHAVLAVYFAYSGHKKVRYKKKNGNGTGIHLSVFTEVFQFFGDCKSKGKMHDHAYHIQCLLKIILENENRRKVKMRDGVHVPFVYYIETDNCPGQYKCRHNFVFIASICNDYLNKIFPGRNVRIEHVFAQKYRFKGVWDGEGKVTKKMLRDSELSNVRTYDATSAYLNAVELLAVEQRKYTDDTVDDMGVAEFSVTKNLVNTVNSRKVLFGDITAGYF